MTSTDDILGRCNALREYFPAALAAFEDLDAADTLELLAKAPDPASAARLSIGQISAALKRARRRDIPAKAEAVQTVLRAEYLGQPAVVTAGRTPRRCEPWSHCWAPSTSRSKPCKGR